MKTNLILEEVWRIKDQLAAEAGYDIDRFFENLRKWEAEHPETGEAIRRVVLGGFGVFSSKGSAADAGSSCGCKPGSCCG